jgi:hypothetical protein
MPSLENSLPCQDDSLASPAGRYRAAGSVGAADVSPLRGLQDNSLAPRAGQSRAAGSIAGADAVALDLLG